MCRGIFNKNNNYTIIIGCGILGIDLAVKICNNEDVLIIDNNVDAFNNLPSNFCGKTLVASGTDIDILKNAKIKNATSVISVTNDDNVNIMISLLAREMFDVKNVIARLYNPNKKRIYEEFEIQTICPTLISSDVITKLMNNKQLLEEI